MGNQRAWRLPAQVEPVVGRGLGPVFAYAGWVYPYLIGNGISCGMEFWRTDLARNLTKLDRHERRLVDLDGRWSGDAAAWLADGGVAPTAHDLSLDTIGLGKPFTKVQAVKQIVDAAAHRVHRLGAGSSAPASSGACRPRPSRCGGVACCGAPRTSWPTCRSPTSWIGPGTLLL